MKPDRLKEIPLFSDLSGDDLERLGGWTDEVDLPAGKPLISQGNFPHEFMVLESGTAEVTHDGEHLADLGPGDFFGEMALLEEQRRMASVMTTSEATVIVMHARNFHAMEEAMPEVAARIREVMEERRREHEAKGIES
ncbi:MAG TPA: cyclic nucleotide-binding domain-containing protein [Actinomycetota bacterium]|nr:cyclic nucleotide-binding domain-containing protein [Actinomycetota bacterium]